MRHSPLHSWIVPAATSRLSVDAAPRARLACLFGVFLVPILLVSARLVWLQLVIPERFLATWNETTETFESIPARDGRILTADGQVLAVDQTRYSVSVHYRWLEEPVNPDWLRAKAREALSREDRKKTDRVKAAEQEVLIKRDQLWNALADLTGHSPTELGNRRQEIQQRVEAISQAVNNRRAKRATSRAHESSTDSVFDRLWRELSTPPDRVSSQPVVLKEELEAHPVIDDVPVEQIAIIESQASRFPGVELQPTTERLYPQGDLASHLIGLRVPVDDMELSRRRTRFPQGDPLALELGDRLGRDGLERSYDSHLRGLRGLRRVVRNHAGEIIEQEIIRPPHHGADVTLTLDASLQRQAEQLLDRTRQPPASPPMEAITMDASIDAARPLAGSIVVLDLRSGDIVVAANSPRIELSALQHPTREQWQTWTTDPRHPFVSRVTQATVPPGTLFQTVTAIAGLEQGVLDPEATVQCQGYLHDPQRDRCALFLQTGQGHGEMTLRTALSRSCNVYFFDLAERLGPQPIEKWARQLGFGAPTGIDIGGEHAGDVPSRSSLPEGQRWYPGMTRKFAIGQGGLTVTPLQVTCLMAVIGSGGRRVTPHLVPPQHPDLEASSTGDSIQLISGFDIPSPHSHSKIMSERSLQLIRQALHQSVDHPLGTGTSAQIPGLPIAGNAGTADGGSDKPTHAWFAGYVPADRPRYAFAVYLEHGGSGSTAAAPIARQLLMSMVEADLLSPAP